jgi:hypothetical protein
LPRGRGRPEVLGGRGSPRRSSRNLTVFDPERIEVDVLDVGVCDAPEVACDGRLRADPDEERLCRGAFAADPYLPQPVVVPDPIRPTGVDLESLARQRVARCRKALSRRLQIAALALGSVDPEKEAAACRQPKPEQGDDAAEDDEYDAAGAQCCLRRGSGSRTMVASSLTIFLIESLPIYRGASAKRATPRPLRQGYASALTTHRSGEVPLRSRRGIWGRITGAGVREAPLLLLFDLSESCADAWVWLSGTRT